MFVVFDLDGTLALNSHREHFLRKEPKDWSGFFKACVDDKPNWPIIGVLQDLKMSGHYVEIWSGRSVEVMQETNEWLVKHGVVGLKIKMRHEGDYRPDVVVKREWLRLLQNRPTLVFDDRNSVVNMWREEGIVCCQVAPGDF